MIGTKDCTKDQLVLEKLKTMKVDDIFDIPNVFQTITRAYEPSSTAWRSLMSHPFTPSYIRLNLPAYIQAVKVMVVHHSEDLKFVQESLQYLHKRLVYEKNKKRVYVSVVENILSYLLEKHDDPDARAVLDDIVLNKEALSLLEAYLTAKMSNFTSVLVQQSKSLELAQTCTLFQILCSGKKSKKSNKMLLRWFTEVCDLDVLKNVALLGVIRTYRIYQIEEDREQGYEISTHFSSLLSSLAGAEYCSVAIAILPLNYTVVTLEQALLHCNDLLLAELALTYHKTGKLLLLFQQIVLRFNPRVSLGKEFRSQLSEVSSKLSEQQLLALITLLSSTLEENSPVSNSEPTAGSDEITESRDPPKRQRVSDERLCGFIADCTSVLISQSRVDLPEDVVLTLHNITKNLPPSTGKTLRLFFNSAVLFDKISSIHPFEVDETPPSNEEEVQLLIKSLHYSDSPTDKLDSILSTISLYPDVILSNFLIIYNNMITDHMMTVAEFLLSTIREHSWFIESEVFSRCTDLHSAIISRVMRDMGAIEEKYYSEPLVDITLSSARDIIKSELSSSISELPLKNHVDLLYLLSQLSVNSSYHRLLITTWILFRQMSLNKDKLDVGCLLSGGVVSYLARFCKPPPPHTPLPVVHGKLAGQILSEILSFSAGGTSEFIEIYLGVGVSMSSADLSAVVEYLGSHQVQHSDVIGMFVKEMCIHKASASRYHEDLLNLRGHIKGILINCENLVPKPMSNVIAQCELLCTIHDLESYFSDKVELTLDNILDVCFEIALSLLKSPLLGLEYKLKLTQNLLDNVIQDKVAVFTEVLLDSNEDLYLLDEKKVDLKTSSDSFIEKLIASLPNKNAEFLLHHTKFDPALVETISAPIIPVSLIPKFINKLTKVQVMNSFKHGCDDPYLLSKCLLCLVQHNYPIHLLNNIYDSILMVLANEGYITAPQTIANIVRASELLSKQKEVARHHVPYILCTVFEYVSKSNPALVRDITPAVHPLFDVCVVQGLQYLQARLSQPARQLFLQLQSHYKQNVKYQGKT